MWEGYLNQELGGIIGSRMLKLQNPILWRLDLFFRRFWFFSNQKSVKHLKTCGDWTASCSWAMFQNPTPVHRWGGTEAIHLPSICASKLWTPARGRLWSGRRGKRSWWPGGVQVKVLRCLVRNLETWKHQGDDLQIVIFSFGGTDFFFWHGIFVGMIGTDSKKLHWCGNVLVNFHNFGIMVPDPQVTKDNFNKFN